MDRNCQLALESTCPAGAAAPARGAAAALLAAQLLLATAGCSTLSQRGPVPESVAKCRELSQQSLTAMQQDDWARAETLLAQAIAASPSNVEARRHYAETLWKRGSQRAAVHQLEAILATDADDPTLHVRAGEMYLAMRDYPRARRHAETALGLDVDQGAAWALRGQIHRAEGDIRQALADLHRALSHSPEDARLLLALAELHRDSNQPQRALATLEALADVYPPGEQPPEVLYLRGVTYHALARYDEAAERLRAASLRGKPTTQILHALADAEHRAGHPAAAAATLRRALDLDPQHSPSLALLEKLQLATTAPQSIQR